MGLNSSTKVETNRYELEISVGAEEFENAVAGVFRKNAKKIQVPGFRKGKAPRHMIERIYGEAVFYEDAVNDLYPKAYSEALEEAAIIPVDQADVEVVSVGKEGLTFKAKVTTRPECEIDGYRGIEAEKTLKTVTDADIDGEIDKLRDRNARMVTVEDRPAENTDIAVIDFEGFKDGVAFDGGKAEKHTLTLGSGQFIPGFEEQIVGHSTGDEFDITVTFPEDYQAEELKGAECVFKIVLHEIKKRELPEADDEFAKDVSEFDTLEELRADTAKKLSEQYENIAKETVENRLMAKVVENLKAEIPQVMFENRINDMVRDFEYRLSSQGMNLDIYLQYTGSTMEDFRGSFAQQAEQQVKLRLALEQIAKNESIEVTEEDLAAEYAKFSENYKMDIEQIKSFVSEKDLREDIAANKALDLVRDSAVITEKPFEEAEKSDKAESGDADKKEKKPAKKPAAKKAKPAAKSAEETDAEPAAEPVADGEK